MLLDDRANETLIDDMIHDDELISRAKQGDPEAFGELVSRHRAKAYGWAKKMTYDSYLAEDIVQEALLQAFLKISTLIDAEKFIGWFHRIVQNQGHMKLRRGGPYAKEQMFSSFTQNEDIDWHNIDHILFQLNQSIENRPTDNPVEQLIRKETIQGLMELLRCLTDRERTIFEQFFFEQLSPKEIAELFQTKVSNVYNVISRSRQKLKRERIRIEIKNYVEVRGKKGLPSKRILDQSKLI
ncbi:RNA polymerase sigma factor [Tenuibacillus multivorans]|uniref:RNA polymerase sigma factor, sigma-70 family n=1 Tax=Tenuibacillus multivorans TaxID=237069 RepID=A0A1H0AS89_9BACI|nr:RNA polymerase sigma factor [Tenuibacillus multivorans]GEL77842.1 DNA-directed RNA polymerase sigma-70 factor [Tenuibacillus multivorans]SDN36327.1 RNA polymerase sigma factor, sigma-70 family [Tenuibacillus multivorans]